MSGLDPWKKRIIPGIVVLLIIIASIIFAVIRLNQNYRAGEFWFNFGTNIAAAVIGVVIGAVLAIIVTLMIINPCEKHKEEKRLKPLRESILLFWDHHLTMYTVGVLQVVECPPEIEKAISDVSMEVIHKIDSLADEEKLHKIRNWLRDITSSEELSARSSYLLKEELDDLRYFIDRMHGTLVALPHLFKETSEVAYGLEMLSSNFLSALRMLDLNIIDIRESEPIKLSPYKTAIIKKTAYDALLLIEEMRRARLKT